jgi:hypothetical protein
MTNWLAGKYVAPGYSYCGFGNNPDDTSDDPRNPSDAVCRNHDIDYINFAKVKDKAPKDKLIKLIRESDNRLIKGLQVLKDRDLSSFISEYLVRLKMSMEDLGIFSPYKFVV